MRAAIRICCSIIVGTVLISAFVQLSNAELNVIRSDLVGEVVALVGDEEVLASDLDARHVTQEAPTDEERKAFAAALVGELEKRFYLENLVDHGIAAPSESAIQAALDSEMKSMYGPEGYEDHMKQKKREAEELRRLYALYLEDSDAANRLYEAEFRGKLPIAQWEEMRSELSVDHLAQIDQFLNSPIPDADRVRPYYRWRIEKDVLRKTNEANNLKIDSESFRTYLTQLSFVNARIVDIASFEAMTGLRLSKEITDDQALELVRKRHAQAEARPQADADTLASEKTDVASTPNPAAPPAAASADPDGTPSALWALPVLLGMLAIYITVIRRRKKG